MIEMMHVYDEDFHRHQGADLDALVLRMSLVVHDTDDLDSY